MSIYSTRQWKEDSSAEPLLCSFTCVFIWYKKMLSPQFISVIHSQIGKLYQLNTDKRWQKSNEDHISLQNVHK